MDSATELKEAWKQHQAGKVSDAKAVYLRIVTAEPQNATAWCYLGLSHHDLHEYMQAIAAYNEAVKLFPGFVVAYNNMGNSFRALGRLDDALKCFDHALKLQPDYYVAIKNKGTALVWGGFPREAIDCFREALKLAPEDAECHSNIGLLSLLLGDFEVGWPEYAFRWKTDKLQRPKIKQPLWDGSSLDGKTILLTPEQGLGDTVQFIRYAAVLKGMYDCRTIFAAPKSLWRLLKSCPGIDVLLMQGDPIPPIDCYIPLLDIPGLLKHDSSTFPRDVPYLKADPTDVARWQELLRDQHGLKVGLVWQGNPKHQADRLRSIPLDAFAPLSKLKGIQLISCQKGDGMDQLAREGARLNIFDLEPFLEDFAQTAAALMHLDLLITVDTSIAHVAAALGVPTWILVTHPPDWRWLMEGKDSVWYPSVRLFRQPRAGDWKSVIDSVIDELKNISPTVRPRTAMDYRLATLGPNRLVRARYGLMMYNRFDLYVGRSIENYGEFSEFEMEVLRQIVRPGSVVVEVGANIGALTLPLAQLVGDQGRVIAIEPQPQVFQVLVSNIAMNHLANTEPRHAAVGAIAGTAKVPSVSFTTPGNFGGVSLENVVEGTEVPLITIDSLNLTRCDVLKVDVEGMELDVLRGAEGLIARCKPILYVENDRLEKSKALIDQIQSFGYRLYWHLPRLFNASNYFESAQNVFGNTVSSNMLCIHKSVATVLNGLREITSSDEHWLAPSEAPRTQPSKRSHSKKMESQMSAGMPPATPVLDAAIPAVPA